MSVDCPYHDVLKTLDIIIAAVEEFAHEFYYKTKLIIDLRIVAEALSVKSVADSICLERVQREGVISFLRRRIQVDAVTLIAP